jgi:tripartite-type tricarboxylate transporter receptor subunit TctC
MRDLARVHRRAAAIFVAAAAALLPASAALAQSYPAAPVKVVVPFGAGGATDILARVFSDRLAQNLGQPFTVENRGGAAGQIAATAVARSPADGSTLMFTTAAPITIAPLMNDKVQYDPRKDFVPVAVVAVMPVWLVVNANSPLKSAADIIRNAKDNPGKLNYGTSGVGTELHLAAEAVSRSAAIQMVHVPFRGGGEVIAALLGNQLDFAALSTASIAGPLKQGSLRALAVSSPQRMADFPDVPTFAEIGHPGATMMPWWGLWRRPGRRRPPSRD